jgi:hypothetical protein
MSELRGLAVLVGFVTTIYLAWCIERTRINTGQTRDAVKELTKLIAEIDKRSGGNH